MNNYDLKFNFFLMIKKKYNILYIFNLNISYNANGIVFEKIENELIIITQYNYLIYICR